MSSDNAAENPKKPQHIAIIMDGNGRWAEQNKVSRSKGHETGGKTVQRIIDLCLEKNIPWQILKVISDTGEELYNLTDCI